MNIGNRRPVAGQLIVDGEDIRVVDGGQTTELKTSQVVSITVGSERELDRWSAKIALGANLRSGNTEQVDYNVRLTLDRRVALSRFYLDAIVNKSETNEVETADNIRVDSYFDWYFSRHWFYRVAQFNYFRDPFQNIAHRYTVSSALGYGIIDTNRVEWGVLAGPGYLYNDVEDDQNASSNGSFVGVIGSELEWEINKIQDFTGRYQIVFTDEETGGIIHNMVLTLENEIIDDFDIDISFIWDRVADPLPRNDGTRPDPDDYRIILSLGYTL